MSVELLMAILMFGILGISFLYGSYLFIRSVIQWIINLLGLEFIREASLSIISTVIFMIISYTLLVFFIEAGSFLGNIIYENIGLIMLVLLSLIIYQCMKKD